MSHCKIVTYDEFTAMMEISNKVTEIINKVAIASKEQATGIVQISNTVISLDGITQQNAINASELHNSLGCFNLERNAQVEPIHEETSLICTT